MKFIHILCLYYLPAHLAHDWSYLCSRNSQNDPKCISEMYSRLFRSITSEQKVSEPIENNVYVIEQKNWKKHLFGRFYPKKTSISPLWPTNAFSSWLMLSLLEKTSEWSEMHQWDVFGCLSKHYKWTKRIRTHWEQCLRHRAKKWGKHLFWGF